MGFYFKEGFLYCENLKIKDIQERVQGSPFYLYSLERLRTNFTNYQTALEGIPSIISYAIKANANLTILRYLQKMGSGATLVSGNELKLALQAGFDPSLITYNGNGKTIEELSLAVKHGIMINIDSEFDLRHIRSVAEKEGVSANVTLRINPDIDPEVHPYISTGLRNSKFGIQNENLDWYLDRIKKADSLNLIGLHCHIGSTIKKVRIFQDATMLMIRFFNRVKEEGFPLKVLNIGGGLGIDYEKDGAIPSQADLIDSIKERLSEEITLIIEPGRSIIGDACVLVNRVIGEKTNWDTHFIVTDGSMAELIRPSLYDAYHHIGFIEPVEGEEKVYDIVGPICESSDFLGKERTLSKPHEGAGLVVYDTGAYGYAMSSNYNIKTRPAEYLVDGDSLIQIRREESFEDFSRLFTEEKII